MLRDVGGCGIFGSGLGNFILDQFADILAVLRFDEVGDLL